MYRLRIQIDREWRIGVSNPGRIAEYDGAGYIFTRAEAHRVLDFSLDAMGVPGEENSGS